MIGYNEAGEIQRLDELAKKCAKIVNRYARQLDQAEKCEGDFIKGLCANGEIDSSEKKWIIRLAKVYAWLKAVEEVHEMRASGLYSVGFTRYSGQQHRVDLMATGLMHSVYSEKDAAAEIDERLLRGLAEQEKAALKRKAATLYADNQLIYRLLAAVAESDISEKWMKKYAQTGFESSSDNMEKELEKRLKKLEDILPSRQKLIFWENAEDRTDAVGNSSSTEVTQETEDDSEINGELNYEMLEPEGEIEAENGSGEEIYAVKKARRLTVPQNGGSFTLDVFDNQISALERLARAKDIELTQEREIWIKQSLLQAQQSGEPLMLAAMMNAQAQHGAQRLKAFGAEVEDFWAIPGGYEQLGVYGNPLLKTEGTFFNKARKGRKGKRKLFDLLEIDEMTLIRVPSEVSSQLTRPEGKVTKKEEVSNATQEETKKVKAQNAEQEAEKWQYLGKCCAEKESALYHAAALVDEQLAKAVYALNQEVQVSGPQTVAKATDATDLWYIFDDDGGRMVYKQMGNAFPKTQKKNQPKQSEDIPALFNRGINVKWATWEWIKKKSNNEQQIKEWLKAAVDRLAEYAVNEKKVKSVKQFSQAYGRLERKERSSKNVEDDVSCILLAFFCWQTDTWRMEISDKWDKSKELQTKLQAFFKWIEERAKGTVAPKDGDYETFCGVLKGESGYALQMFRSNGKIHLVLRGVDLVSNKDRKLALEVVTGRYKPDGRDTEADKQAFCRAMIDARRRFMHRRKGVQGVKSHEDTQNNAADVAFLLLLSGKANQLLQNKGKKAVVYVEEEADGKSEKLRICQLDSAKQIKAWEQKKAESWDDGYFETVFAQEKADKGVLMILEMKNNRPEEAERLTLAWEKEEKGFRIYWKDVRKKADK